MLTCPQCRWRSPQLVARWEEAKTAEPYAGAVLTAALDAVGLGARAPLSPDLLRALQADNLDSQASGITGRENHPSALRIF